jgi:hypothetical protein
VFPDRVDVDNEHCVSYSEKNPALADALEKLGLGAALLVCAVGTFGACAVAVVVGATGSVVVDVSRACSSGEAAEAAVVDVLLAWAGFVLFSAPLSLSGLPKTAEGTIGSSVGAVPVFLGPSDGGC